jgi:hypothetical protein
MSRRRRILVPVKDKAYITELERLVPVKDLLAFLYRQGTPEDARWNRLADMIKSHPATKPRLLATMAFECKLSYQDLAAAWIREQQLNGLMRQASHVPRVLEDMAEDSYSRDVLCERCKGNGVIVSGDDEDEDPIGEECPLCKGKGQVRKPGDAAAREMLLKTQKLIETGKGGVAVQVNVPQVPQSAPSLKDVLAEVRGALAQPKQLEAIDADS